MRLTRNKKQGHRVFEAEKRSWAEDRAFFTREGSGLSLFERGSITPHTV